MKTRARLITNDPEMSQASPVVIIGKTEDNLALVYFEDTPRVAFYWALRDLKMIAPATLAAIPYLSRRPYDPR